MLQSLKAGSNVGLSFLKEDVSSQVSPAEFIELMNVNTSLQLISDTVEELKQTKLSIGKQKPDLADFNTRATLHGTENFIYHLFNSVRPIDKADLENWAVNLRRLAECYTALIPSVKRPSAERKSREVLAIWCLVAIIDHIAREQWPQLFTNVGMALPVELLEGLTFRERSLMETAANLIAHKKTLGNSEGLFDYKSPSETRQFAVNYFDSTEGVEMQNCLEAERNQEIVRRKEREKQLKIAEERYTALSQQQCACYYARHKLKRCRRCIDINTLKGTPSLVQHPLPIDDCMAKEVVFFAMQPSIFRSYAAIALQAYIIHGNKLQPERSTDCVAWSLGAGLNLKRQSDTPALLTSTRKTLETNSHFKKLAPFTVDVVYPDFSAEVALQISGGHCSFSTFQYDVAGYQYRLGGALSNLSWMADANHTENAVLAAQYAMPSSMMKNEFIAFGRVRAAPNLQIRELFMALQTMSDKQLNSDDMLTLVQRVLCEMGPTSETLPCMWTWKLDLFSENWLTLLHQSLADKLSNIRQNWESHAIMRLIIDVSTFAVQFGKQDSFVDLLTEARKTILEWINEVVLLIKEFIDKPDLVLKWRLLLVQFYSYLLLGSRVVTEKDLQYRTELSKLKSICGNGITLDIYDLLSLVDSHIFNNTATIHRLVQNDTSFLNQLLPEIGMDSNAPWKRVNHNGKLIDWYSSGPYMVNPISGLILLDGLTVSELPSVVVQMPIYQEVMTNANFIVQRVNNEYVSAPFGTRKFKFGMWEYNNSRFPFVKEQHDDGRELTLLPRAFLAGSGLPGQLVGMAHWVDFANQIIEFRPKDFRCTNFSHWMKLDTGECFVNDVYKSQLLNAYDGHLHDLIKLLTRIDAVQNIICFASSPNEFKVSHINYNLTFTVQENGEIVSDNYPGYKLASRQLVPTFPLFSSYLYIKPQNALSTKLPLLLIPDGGQIYPYEFDEVHQRLIPSTTLARLILARIYMQHSCTLDPLAQTTGVQQAFELLQQCWQNSPFSSTEFNVLSSFMSFEVNSPIAYSIKLLVHHLDQVSRRVEFLHPAKAIPIPKDWNEGIALVVKRYFKTKHTLPISCVLDPAIEKEFALRWPPVQKATHDGRYFSRVAKIFFSKETIPLSFDISGLFTEVTTMLISIIVRKHNLTLLGYASIFIGW